MPQEGEVGGGHQNDWKPEGTIYEKHPNCAVTLYSS